MKWFEGPIPEAIKLSKQKGVVFVVYIHGKALLIGIVVVSYVFATAFDPVSCNNVLSIVMCFR